MTTDERFLAVLRELGPEAPERWTAADEPGRVAMALAISQAVSRKLGPERGKIAFAIMFQQATAS
jgi:hypothetical protein